MATCGAPIAVGAICEQDSPESPLDLVTLSASRYPIGEADVAAGSVEAAAGALPGAVGALGEQSGSAGGAHHAVDMRAGHAGRFDDGRHGVCSPCDSLDDLPGSQPNPWSEESGGEDRVHAGEPSGRQRLAVHDGGVPLGDDQFVAVGLVTVPALEELVPAVGFAALGAQHGGDGGVVHQSGDQGE